MTPFPRRDGALHAESIALSTLAGKVGTPVYVYSAGGFRAQARRLREALAAHPEIIAPLIAFAVKANGNRSVLAVLAAEGLGADTVSEGEIRRALAGGVPPDRIVFSGVGKTDAELAFAVETGVRQINIESATELERLIAVARERGRVPDIAIRVNPAIGAGGHAKITTGGAGDKFGVPAAEALELYARAAAPGAVRPVGLACHIGSQITDVAPLRSAFAVMRGLVETLRGEGLAVERLDLGGGLGVPYRPGDPDTPFDAYAEVVAETVRDLDVQLVLEPGRVIAAEAGVLLSRVIQVTERPDGRRFLVLDAAMNDLKRPALYDAEHDIVAVAQEGAGELTYDVVGPVCETGDTLARGRRLPSLAAGDLVAIRTAGAYGATMASEYNARLLVPEVLVDGERWAVIRRRPAPDAFLEREPVAEWLGLPAKS